jgi:hypothetical protein
MDAQIVLVPLVSPGVFVPCDYCCILPIFGLMLDEILLAGTRVHSGFLVA